MSTLVESRQKHYSIAICGVKSEMEFGEYFDLGNIIKTQSELADDTVYAMTKHAAVAFAKGTDQMILDAIIQKAKENGITDLYVLNEDFILSAIKEKVEKSCDVAPVVRCRECKHYKEFRTRKNKQIMRLCYRMGKHDMEYPVRPDDFCSYGERSTNTSTEK